VSERVIAVVTSDDGADLRYANRAVGVPGVSSVLRAEPAGVAAAVDEALAAGAQWIWLLGPRDEPEPDALARLLDIAGSGDAVGLVGPRLQVTDSDRLVSAGVTATAQGQRVNPVSPGEVDQGQFGRTEDVYAVDLPGALVAADVVRAVGAPAASLPTSYRGIEYSRRVRAAGFRVVLAPRAEVVVPAATARALLTSPRPPRAAADVRVEHRYRLAIVRPARAWRTALLLWCAAVGSALGRLLANDVRGAGRWLAAAARVSADARAVAPLRRRAPVTESAPALLATRPQLDAARRELRETGADGTAAWWARTDTAADLDPESPAGAEEALNTGEELQSFSGVDVGPRRSLLLHPFTGVLLLTVLASALIGWRLLGPGTLTGGALPRLDVSAGQALDRILSLRDDAGLGSVAPADPLLSVLLAWSLPFLGSLDTAVRVLLLVALPAAALLAYACAGRITARASIRALLALVWAGSPALVVSLIEGRVGAVLAWLALPVLVRALHSAVDRRSVEASAAAGLLLVVVAAGMPILIVPVLVLIGVIAVRTRAPRLAWSVIPLVALAGPWLAAAVRHPDALLTEPGEVLPYPVARSWILALGWPEVPVSQALVGTAAAPWVGLILLVSLPLVVAAGAAYFRRSVPDDLLVVSTALTVSGLSLAIAQTMTASGLTAHRLVAAWPAAGLALFTLGLCGLLTASLVRAPGRRSAAAALPTRRRSRGVMAAAAGSAALVLAALSVDATVGGIEVHRDGDARLPVFAGERAAGPLAQRTLVLEAVDGEVVGTLRGATGGTVLETSMITDARQLHGFGPQRRPVALDAADTVLAEAVGRLTSEGSGDAGAALAQLGVGFVVLTGDDADAVDAAARSVSGATGLTRLGVADQGLLWQVSTAQDDGADEAGDDSGAADDPATGASAEVSRARVVDATGASAPVEIVDGAVEVTGSPLAASGEGPRLLVLAERTGVTTAHVDGRALEEADPVDGWAQAYVLPGGEVSVELSASPVWYRVVVVCGWILVLMSAVVAVPIGRGGRR
jgi:hypothetical protein